LLTRDTKAGREWLDVNATLNSFVTDVQNPTVLFPNLGNLNPIYDLGFRFATTVEVNVLFSNAGIPDIYPDDNVVGYSVANYVPV